MAPLLPDLTRSAVAAIVLLAVVLPASPAVEAAAIADKLDVQIGDLKELNLNEGTLVGARIEITDGPGILIKADTAQGSQITETYANSHWELTGHVHIEYDGSVLDADSATVTFADRLIELIEVHGTPALFSHPARTAGQRYEGRAENIYFDGGSRVVRFTGQPWFSFGSRQCTSDKPLLYAVDSTVLSSERDGKPDAGVRCTYGTGVDGHVPTPRTPERSSAQ